MNLLDLGRVRAVLREMSRAPDAVDRLEISYVKFGRDGFAQALFDGTATDGQRLCVSARRFKETKGTKLEEILNARVTRPTPPDASFPAAAFYSSELQLLFQVFPADEHLPALTTAVDAEAMTPLLGAALAPWADGARLSFALVQVRRY